MQPLSGEAKRSRAVLQPVDGRGKIQLSEPREEAVEPAKEFDYTLYHVMLHITLGKGEGSALSRCIPHRLGLAAAASPQTPG